ncbi:hypothetical protein ACIBJE_29175 [Micromonospora sp. NPDC050187]|uniref:hypothetical protein n=1 Tax=Micromonospora sp. NPDC050187 TaxID=3364277 RepID=UPI00379A1179
MAVTAGQRGESPQFSPVLVKVRVARNGSGRPLNWPDTALSDNTQKIHKPAQALAPTSTQALDLTGVARTASSGIVVIGIEGPTLGVVSAG